MVSALGDTKDSTGLGNTLRLCAIIAGWHERYRAREGKEG